MEKIAAILSLIGFVLICLDTFILRKDKDRDLKIIIKYIDCGILLLSVIFNASNFAFVACGLYGVVYCFGSAIMLSSSPKYKSEEQKRIELKREQEQEQYFNEYGDPNDDK